jgi:hypothetical protein
VLTSVLLKQQVPVNALSGVVLSFVNQILQIMGVRSLFTRVILLVVAAGFSRFSHYNSCFVCFFYLVGFPLWLMPESHLSVRSSFNLGPFIFFIPQHTPMIRETFSCRIIIHNEVSELLEQYSL